MVRPHNLRMIHYYVGQPSLTVDPQGPATGVARVTRDGGWGSSDVTGRAAFRNNRVPDSRSGFIVGFRVAKSQ